MEMSQHTIKILGVEDNPHIIRLIREYLSESTSLDFHLQHVQELAGALAAVRDKCFDLILLDLTLPDSFGLETFDDVYAAASTSPIVILTNTDDDAQAIEAMRRGAQDYLVKKQLDAASLARSLRYAIERKKAAAELASLQLEVTNIALAVQRKIGQQLHDGLGQHLTGIGLMGKTLQKRLEREQSPVAEPVAELVELITEAAGQVRALVRGLHPVDVDAEGLSFALQQLADSVTRTCNITCTFDSEARASIPDNRTATELYHIAQEACNNAVKHAKAEFVKIRLDPTAGQIVLTISDDGVGISPTAVNGMGVRIMEFRASSIGAALDISNSDKGVVVECILPQPTKNNATESIT